MNNDLIAIIIVATIAVLLTLIVLLLAASALRRVRQGRRFRKLDALQAEYQRTLPPLIERDGGKEAFAEYMALPGSVAWQALENILFDLREDRRYEERIHRLFHDLGYIAYYEGLLLDRNALVRLSAVDKLGRMRSRSSITRLLAHLDETTPDIVTVTVRALSRIGTEEGLQGIIDRLPALLGKSLVTRKAMETSLLNFGAAAISHLVAYQDGGNDPWISSCILETLSHLPPDERSVTFAAARLQSTNAEVRSKALKVLERAGQDKSGHLAESILPLVGDPVWFVRLQAVRVLRAAGGEQSSESLKERLSDENWRVRNEAALALALGGDRAITVFHEALFASDSYAKESLCEEIEKTGYAIRLIENLVDPDETLRARSREILTVMQDLHFSTPLVEYLEAGGDERIKGEIRALLEKPKS